MSATLDIAINLIEDLKKAGIQTILYGSLGVSIYLGNFKKFGDVDLLVEDHWLGKRWEDLLTILSNLGFKLIDTQEHEFSDVNGLVVAFAKKSILARDGIVISSKDIAIKDVKGSIINVLSPEAFKRAYEFSKKDGYRRNVRQKNDEEVIRLIDNLKTSPKS